MRSIPRPAAGAVFHEEAGVLWTASEGQVTNAGVFAVCLLTFWLFVPLLYAGLRAWRTARHHYVLTDQRLREHTGIVNRNTEDLSSCTA